MPTLATVRKHEVSFCADVKSWLDELFAKHPEWPFGEAHIEEYGTGSNKRSDLRILGRADKIPLLAGETKMPGTPEGRSPYDPDLMRDASEKAENIKARYFFTWNVNTFVLFDRSEWNAPIIERRLKDWELHLGLTNSGQCSLPEVQAYIRDKFLPEFFAEFAEIVEGRKPDWGLPPDEVFIHSLHSHLDWPVAGTRDFLAEQSGHDRAFAARLQRWLAEELQWTFDPSNQENWRAILDRAARTLCYVFCNRAIFYDAIRAKHEAGLAKLAMPSDQTDHHKTYEHFRNRFAAAQEVTGDYEPIFFPHVDDSMGAVVFASAQARQGWKGVLANLDQYNFHDIPHDIVGGIFQKLIAPEERQKFGQYFTHEDIVDVINAFCIRRAGDVVLDPACGSGSFLVRAYHRKAWLSEHKGGGRRHFDKPKTHEELLQELFGCDIAVFPAHLATLNLAARRFEDDDNYPLIRRGNFFEIIERPDAFCTVPIRLPGGKKEDRAVGLPPLDAIVGNPPYVRQELIPKAANLKSSKGERRSSFESRLKTAKEYLQKAVMAAWPGLQLSGRSDLHCYFWPIACKHLKEGGFFGFLTSSSWLDVEYGFQLQKWILQNFKLLAVLESVDEPWFEDARIKTCATILQRCSDEKARDENVVKFVRLQKPLAAILGERAHGDETSRQEAAMSLRKLIESKREVYADEMLRIIPVPQSQLWQEGVEAGRVMAKGPLQDLEENNAGNGDNGNASDYKLRVREQNGTYVQTVEDYSAGKWGRFLRAPEIYFRIMRDYGRRFVKLGEIAEIRRGITSGCDAFFMPRDVTAQVLEEVRDKLPWNDVGLMTHCPLKEVEKGRVRIIRAGDNTLHPVEAEYLRPEVHSLMAVDRPVIRAADVDRVVLWVNKPLKELAGTYAAAYIRWGAKQTFASSKSRTVRLPRRTTCASRPIWYDLTGTSRGTVFWPMSQQYRHIVAANPEGLVCNHNLFFLRPKQAAESMDEPLAAVLNSTIVGLFKTFYGRYAGTEGNLKTEVVDVTLLPVPDVRGVSTDVRNQLAAALQSMQERKVGHLVEEAFMASHDVDHCRELENKPVGLSNELRQSDRRQLDDAVLQVLGMTSRSERERTLEELYLETARHYRQIRIMEIQKQVQRAGGKERKLTAEDIAGSIWDSLDEAERGPELPDWLRQHNAALQTLTIPDGKARAFGASYMFSPSGVDYVHGKAVAHETYASPEQAALVATLANLEIRGGVQVPATPADCDDWGRAISSRLSDMQSRFDELAGSRTSDQKLREGIVTLLMQWFVHGRGVAKKS